MTTLRKFSRSSWMEIVLILLIAAVTYLPHLSQATVYRDDWYYIMDRTIGGPGIFQEMFSIDRPARGPLFEAYYQLFGVQPLPYHMSSFLWRVLGGLAALWLFRQVWPRQRLATFVMALFFTLYPGYLRWMEGFENQPRILSSFLEVLSIALTVFAVTTSRRVLKFWAWTASILLGWAYIALVDFSFGMEVFRLLCVYLVVNRDQKLLPFTRKLTSAVHAWAIAAVIPAGFLFWRMFIFQNERPVTDIGLQLSYLTSSPLLTGMWWLMRLLQSAANVAVLAWGAPNFQNLFENSLSDILTGFLIAGAAILLLLWAGFSLWDAEEEQPEYAVPPSRDIWQMEAIWTGLIGVFAGVLPVIVANRYVTFAGYSHYSLPASLAGVTLLVGVIFLIRSRNALFGIVSLFVLLAILTHYTASLRVLREEQVIANTWHQMVWRAPGIKAGTTLVVNYPGVDYAEDVDAAAGPANFIYYPEQTNQIPAVYRLVALSQMDYTTMQVLGRDNRPYGYRTHVGEIDYDNLLVISQPYITGCVHIIDAQWPRYSDQDPDQILLLGPYSKIQNVLTGVSAPRLTESIFGPEPARGWCYYYQKAELALQQGDWEKIVQLGNEAAGLKLSPNDRIEWMPFLQAYAILGDGKNFKSTAVKMDSTPFVRRQACQTLLKMQESGPSFTSEIQSLMDEKLCHGQTQTNP